MDEVRGITTYPVGLLDDIKQRRVKSGMERLWYRVQDRKWRSVKAYFNGYLAEWGFPPAHIQHQEAGHGWTRQRAIKRLIRNIERENNILPSQAKRLVWANMTEPERIRQSCLGRPS